MKVGITYDLKSDYIKMGYTSEEAAEFDSEETIEGIENALRALGFETSRIGNVKELVRKLAAGERWDMVFNIAEGMYGYGRESQVPCVLDAYQIPYTFSDPMVLALTLHKGMTKHIIQNLNLNTPKFQVVKNMKDVRRITNLEYPLFIKPVAEGTGKGISKKSVIENSQELEIGCRELLVKFRQPVLVEEYLPGREFTVGITGTGKDAEITGVIEVLFNEDNNEKVYGYTNKAEYEKKVKYKKPDEETVKKCSRLALSAWRGLGCRDGGRIDIRFDKHGKPSFIEVNPLAGLNPKHSDLPILSRKSGITFENLIKLIMISALKRIKSRKVKTVQLDRIPLPELRDMNAEFEFEI